MSITLLLGGARSGKSELAEARAGAESARLGAGVTYVAGAGPGPEGDADWERRVQAHRRRRPATWETLEAPLDLAGVLAGPELTGRVVLIDSLGTWLARRDDFAWDTDLLTALAGRSLPTLIVSEEVGMGVHPSSESGRAFRDALGRLNREVAGAAEGVFLVVAG
ncbi:MAG: bifunctional adenosylcobinamide kinase/adenosylcobinamide-phosphate guanylyltransferase, partial [Acidimicrobiales bacterium]